MEAGEAILTIASMVLPLAFGLAIGWQENEASKQLEQAKANEKDEAPAP